MTHAVTRAAANAATMARPGRSLNPAQRRAALENALACALHFARQDHTPENLWAATSRARRALTLLKLASEDVRMERA